ncbi:hypothetical protein BBJ28_00015623 [Nothophytophthora sp. Chile5]|nr:hypothetical protein BBJ28_00015623 [Nothophytophthora sp. Chile5]
MRSRSASSQRRGAASPPSEDADERLLSSTHLVVLQHGLLGTSRDFVQFEGLLQSQFREDGVYIHSGECNAGSFFQTYDGVDLGGVRLADEVQELAKKMPNLRKFSMIGHSLGGLYNRYCLGVLFSRGFFANIEPMVCSSDNFVTLATPHLGIRRPRRGTTNFLYNALLPRLYVTQGETRLLKLERLTQSALLFSTAWAEMEGPLLASFQEGNPQDSASEASKGSFKLHHCRLSARKLQIFEHTDTSGEKHDAKIKIDLFRADLKVLLPDGQTSSHGTHDGGSFYANLLGWGQRSSDERTSTASGHFDIQIRWPVSSSGPSTDAANVCVLRIPEEDMHQDWRWLVAFSNASFGMRCVTSTNQGPTPPAQAYAAPPLLSCLARGQFMQALQMFKVRTLYSNIFFDMQVPYSCAAVRSFNPYRLDAKECLTSPIYRHIALNSLRSARKLRDTLPLKIKRLALRYMTTKYPALASSATVGQPQSGVEDASFSLSLSSSGNSAGVDHQPASKAQRKSASVPSDMSEHSGGLFHSHRRRKTVGNAPSASFSHTDKSRPDPFVDHDVILDQLPRAFTSDPEQDELRSMLLSVQSVGWRRIDVLFGSVLAHEHIIAKRANPEKPLNSGIDIVHHVMDTFLL